MATNINNTVLSICQIVSDLYGDNSVNTDASRIRAVSRSIADIASRRYWSFYYLTDQTAGTGDGTTSNFTVGTTDNPIRLNGVAELFVGSTAIGNRYQLVSINRFKTLIANNASEQVAYQWYDSANDLWKVKINPTPSSGSVVYYSYYWEPKELTATTDKVIFPNPIAVARLALAEVFESEDEDGKRNDNMQIANSMIDDEIGNDDTPAPNQTITMGSIENATRSRGIGSY